MSIDAINSPETAAALERLEGAQKAAVSDFPLMAYQKVQAARVIMNSLASTYCDDVDGACVEALADIINCATYLVERVKTRERQK